MLYKVISAMCKLQFYSAVTWSNMTMMTFHQLESDIEYIPTSSNDNTILSFT